MSILTKYLKDLFLRKDIADTKTGNLTIYGTVEVNPEGVFNSPVINNKALPTQTGGFNRPAYRLTSANGNYWLISLRGDTTNDLAFSYNNNTVLVAIDLNGNILTSAKITAGKIASTSIATNTSNTGVPVVRNISNGELELVNCLFLPVVGTTATNNTIRNTGTTLIYQNSVGVDYDLRNYQAPLVSGTNIKTINGNSLLGSGNLVLTSTQNLQQVTDLGAITTNAIRVTTTLPFGNASIAGISIDGFGIGGDSTNGYGVFGNSENGLAVFANSINGTGLGVLSENSIGAIVNIGEFNTSDIIQGIKSNVGTVFKISHEGDTTANSFIKNGGLSTEFLKADGSIDTNIYLTSNTFIDKETPTGLIDGTNTTFTLANVPITGSEHVYRNGLLQEQGVGNDYIISGNTITFLTAPLSGDKLRVTYRI